MNFFRLLLLIGLIFQISADFDVTYSNELEATLRNVKLTTGACQEQYEALLNSQPWDLLQMIDASAKVPVGLLRLNFFQLGDFDECYNIASPTNLGTIYGKYCLGTIPLDFLQPQDAIRNRLIASKWNSTRRIFGASPRTMGQDTSTFGVHKGYCLPSACTAEEATLVTDGLMKFTENYCYSQDSAPELSGGAITTIVILAIFFAIVIISTIYDLILHYKQIKTPHPLLVAFSAFTNGKKLLASTTNSDQLLCLNGIKAISMMWVLLGHVYLNSLMGPGADLSDLADWMQDVINMIIVGSSVSVDTFFAVGGLVTVYTFLKASDRGAKFNVPLYYLHRYIRLTPSLAILVLIHATLITYLGSGPLWSNVTSIFAEDCREYWWSALLYIQNFVHNDDTCVPQTWYLTVDFQLFLLSPFVLIPLKRWPLVGKIILAILISSGIIIPFVIGYIYEIPGFMTNISDGDSSQTMMWSYYKQTHTRFGPYVIGMLAGYYIYQLKKGSIKLKLHPLAVLAVWLVSLGGLLACIFAGHDAAVGEYEIWSQSFALAFLRNAWACCVCGVVLMCITGYGGFIDKFLSLSVFQFLTKLSYSMYLVHYALIAMRYASQRFVYGFSNAHMMWSFWGDFTYTLVLSLVLCLTFESPMITIEKYIFGREKKSSSSKRPEV